MKTIAVICVLLAVAFCATAVQTFEADTMSPKEISDIIVASEPQVAGGEVQASEEDFSDIEDLSDDEDSDDEDEDATSSDLETADEEDDETSDVSEAEDATAAAKRKVVINIWGKNARRAQRMARRSGKKASRRSGKKASRKSGKKASRKSGKKSLSQVRQESLSQVRQESLSQVRQEEPQQALQEDPSSWQANQEARQEAHEGQCWQGVQAADCSNSRHWPEVRQGHRVPRAQNQHDEDRERR
jgi:hypothetical protein